VREFAALKPNELPTLTEEQLHTIQKIDLASENAETPLQRLEHKLHPVVVFVVMPLFALANAGVELPTDFVSALFSPVALGVGLGLLVGKPLGIMAICWLVHRMGWARVGAAFDWSQLLGAAVLAGIGFTMSLFINELAFTDPVLREEAKLGILVASLVAGVVGFLLLRKSPPIKAS
jgi:NhaA family Na+:H+ antiporter